MSGKSTPGPWIRSKHGSQILTADGERSIALLSLPVLHTDAELESVRANARLIAAAPTMADYIAQKAAEGDADAARIMEAIRGNA